MSRLVSVYTFLIRSMIFIIYSFTQKIVIKWPRTILGTRSTTVKKRQTKKKIYFYKTYIILGRETINKIKYIV